MIYQKLEMRLERNPPSKDELVLKILTDIESYLATYCHDTINQSLDLSDIRGSIAMLKEIIEPEEEDICEHGVHGNDCFKCEQD